MSSATALSPAPYNSFVSSLSTLSFNSSICSWRLVTTSPERAPPLGIRIAPRPLSSAIFHPKSGTNQPLQLQIDELKESVNKINFTLDLIIKQLSSVTIQVVDEDGNPVSDVLISGLDENGSFTNDNGKATFVVDSNKSLTININKMADITPLSKTIGPYDATTENSEIVLVTKRNYLKCTTSTALYFSGKTSSIDFTLVGGGGGGAGYVKLGTSGNFSIAYGGGGGGGSSLEMKSISPPRRTLCNIAIGAGGGGGSYYINTSTNTSVLSARNLGKKGGNTSFLTYSIEGGGGGGRESVLPNYTAVQGGGTSVNGGNGGGGYNAPGGNATSSCFYYTSYTTQSVCSGGGGAYNASGGSPNGGSGVNTVSPGPAGTSPGGGGGARDPNYGGAGSGATGIAAFRMYFL